MAHINVKKRRKAFFGESLAAAGITAAATLAGAVMGAAATKKGARDQAAAITDNAKKQAEAIKDQTRENKLGLKEQQNFIKEQNEQKKENDKVLQQNMLRQLGLTQADTSRGDAMIQVRNGGIHRNMPNFTHAEKMAGMDATWLRNNNPTIAKNEDVGFENTMKLHEKFHDDDYIERIGANDLSFLDRMRLMNYIENSEEYNPKDVTHGGSELNYHKFLTNNFRKGLRNGGSNKLQYSLRGVNSKFQVTDGGSVKYIKTTPEGHDLYEIKGDTHEEYHKTKGGKYKSGVGFKFEDGSVIEGEGAPKGQQGELILTTPKDVMFISRHSLKGYNPAKAVKQGEPPVEAFEKQELIKAKYGIKNGGKKAEFGTIGIPENQTPNINIDEFTNISPDKAKVGKRICVGRRKRAENGYTTNEWANLGAAGITGLTNLGASAISMIVNKKATDKINSATQRASDIMTNAYSNLKGINIDDINFDSYRPQHVMAATRAAHIDVTPELTNIEREQQRNATRIAKNIGSAAAKNSLLQRGSLDATDMRSRVYAYKNRAEEDINQKNLGIINDTNRFNAQLDAQANAEIGKQKLELMKYNNEIRNKKILGTAETQANAALQIGQNNGNLRTTNANILGQGISSAVSGVSDTLGDISQNRTNIDIAKMNADPTVIKEWEKNPVNKRYTLGSLFKKKAKYGKILKCK